MQFRRLINQLKADEGYRRYPYLDTANPPVWTVGYGTTFISETPVTENTIPLSLKTATVLLMGDAFQACIDAQELVVNFDEIGSVRREVLANMAYNLGRNGLSKFKRMIAAVELRDFDVAALEMEDSNWFYQVGNRAVRLADSMESGE